MCILNKEQMWIVNIVESCGLFTDSALIGQNLDILFKQQDSLSPGKFIPIYEL